MKARKQNENLMAPIVWYETRKHTPKEGIRIEWMDWKDGVHRGVYLGQQLWVERNGRNTIGIAKVARWRYLK